MNRDTRRFYEACLDLSLNIDEVNLAASLVSISFCHSRRWLALDKLSPPLAQALRRRNCDLTHVTFPKTAHGDLDVDKMQQKFHAVALTKEETPEEDLLLMAIDHLVGTRPQNLEAVRAYLSRKIEAIPVEG